MKRMSAMQRSNMTVARSSNLAVLQHSIYATKMLRNRAVLGIWMFLQHSFLQ